MIAHLATTERVLITEMLIVICHLGSLGGKKKVILLLSYLSLSSGFQLGKKVSCRKLVS